MNAILRTISDDKEREIVVKNYSENGLGFVCAKPIPEREWTPVTIIYEDRLAALRVVMRVNILRGMELPSGLYKYGGVIPQPDEEWTKYVKRKLEKIKERDLADAEGLNT